MPKIERTCKICGKLFYVHPSNLRRNKNTPATYLNAIYCSRACLFKDKEYLSRRAKTLKKHYENPINKERRSEKLRDHYKDPAARQKNSVALRKAYVREETRYAPFEARIGGFWYGNVRYVDYVAPQYCEKWTMEFKERVRAFFKYQCVECGVPQNGSKLDVHHVYYNKKACCDNTPRILVALCHSCHSKTSRGNRTEWSDHFQEIVDSIYGGKCYLTREEYSEAFPVQ